MVYLYNIGDVFIQYLLISDYVFRSFDASKKFWKRHVHLLEQVLVQFVCNGEEERLDPQEQLSVHETSKRVSSNGGRQGPSTAAAEDPVRNLLPPHSSLLPPPLVGDGAVSDGGKEGSADDDGDAALVEEGGELLEPQDRQKGPKCEMRMHTVMRKRLRDKGYTLTEIEGDGHCFF